MKKGKKDSGGVVFDVTIGEMKYRIKTGEQVTTNVSYANMEEEKLP
jgi:hypothetical protein